MTYLEVMRTTKKSSTYFIHETMLPGACSANKGARKDLWIAVPLANIKTLKKNPVTEYDIT